MSPCVDDRDTHVNVLRVTRVNEVRVTRVNELRDNSE